MGLREHVPWWAKLTAKVLLSRLPVPYSLWRRLRVFRHGDMHDPKRALSVFSAHFERALRYGDIKPGFTCLELGPGDSLLTGLVARAFGASKVYMVDSGDFVVRDISFYRAMARLLMEIGKPLPETEKHIDLDSLLSACNIVYLTDGLNSLRTIPNQSIDYFWSQVVFEHVPKREFLALLKEFRRIAKDTSLGSHSIDLRDHLGGGLNNLRFEERIWESDIMSRSGFYTNRLRYSQMLDLFERAGFDASVVRTFSWESVPTPVEKLASPFRSMPIDDLRIAEFETVLRPKSL